MLSPEVEELFKGKLLNAFVVIWHFDKFCDCQSTFIMMIKLFITHTKGFTKFATIVILNIYQNFPNYLKILFDPLK